MTSDMDTGLAGTASASQPALPELLPQQLSGIYRGTVWLTPENVETLPGPLPWQPRARFRVLLEEGSTLIKFSTWQYSSNQVSLGVFRSGLIFPDLCPVTLASPTHVLLAEAAVNRRPLGKVSFNTTRERTRRIATALTCDRYWFLIPFAKNHGRRDRAVSFSRLRHTAGRNRARLQLRNRQYALEMAKLDRLTGGRWLDRKHVWLRILGFFLGIIGSGVLIGALLTQALGKGVTGWVPFMIALGAIMAIAGIVVYIIGERGEPLDRNQLVTE